MKTEKALEKVNNIISLLSPDRKNALIFVSDNEDKGLLMPVNAPATPKTKLD